MFQKIVCAISIFLLVSCNNNNGILISVTKLSSPSKKYDIYESFVDSDYAFGSGRYNTSIIEKGENYNPWASGNFSEYVILGWVGNDTIKVLKFHTSEDYSKDSRFHEFENFNEIVLDIQHKESFGGSSDWYSFDSITFTRDSIYFLKRENHLKAINQIGFLQGQVTIESKGDTITKIISNDFQLINEFKNMKNSYPKVEGVTYELTPNYTLKLKTFNNHNVVRKLDIKQFK